MTYLIFEREREKRISEDSTEKIGILLNHRRFSTPRETFLKVRNFLQNKYSKILFFSIDGIGIDRNSTNIKFKSESERDAGELWAKPTELDRSAHMWSCS